MKGHKIYYKLGISPLGHHFPCWVTIACYYEQIVIYYQGYFPKLWRRATIVPIPKVTIPKEVGDLRPIALTSLPGKILERFVHTQIMEHLDTNNLLNDIQNGFRKKHSTTDTIF